MWRSRHRRSYRPQASPGRDGPGAYIVSYDPYERSFISLDEVRVRVKARRVDVPHVHPVGWAFSQMPNGCVLLPGGHIVRTGCAVGEGLDEDVPVASTAVG